MGKSGQKHQKSGSTVGTEQQSVQMQCILAYFWKRKKAQKRKHFQGLILTKSLSLSQLIL